MNLKITQLTTILTLTQFIIVPTIQAQPIIPATDGTNTQVNPTSNNPNQFNITGGTVSPDDINLFHSFEQFNLDNGQFATFLANPDIQNILGRIVGGEASIIDGTIQVEGANANLFLMNPAGFVFGNHARLHIPGDFVVTTANGIQFGDNWFNATGLNDYSSLTGSPTGFAFTITQPGAIINTGTLEANEGQNITLIGGTFVNNGSIKTPQGQVNITAIPGERFVRISLPGQLLSLEVEALPNNANLPNNWNIPILALPELLTVGNSSEVTGININDNGSLQLPNSETAVSVNSGDVLIQNTLENSGGSVNISGSNITAADIKTKPENNTDAGSINLTADNQINIINMTEVALDAESTTNSTAGGEISLTAQNISIGDINNTNNNLIIRTRNNNITFNGAVTLNQDTEIRLKGDNTNLTISDTLNGVNRGEQALNINFTQGEGNGTVTLNGIGNIAPLSDLSIQTPGEVTVQLEGEFFLYQQTGIYSACDFKWRDYYQFRK
jgi:filamentous hemagglutinin family protein